MMKNKLKGLIIVCFALFIGYVNVDAAGVSYKPNSISKKIAVEYGDGTDKNWSQYKHYNFTISSDGHTFGAYCLDPNYSLPTNVTCESLKSTDLSTMQAKAMYYLYTHATTSEEINLLAIRMLDKSALSNKKKPVGLAIRNYYDKRKSCELTKNASDCSAYKKWLRGTSITGNSILDEAYKLAKTSEEKGAIFKPQFSTVNINRKVTFQKPVVNGTKVTIKAQVDFNISASNIDFSCDGCKITKKEWNGKEGTIELEVTNKKDCKYSVYAHISNENEMFYCSSNSGKYQTFIAGVKFVGSSTQMSVGRYVIMTKENRVATYKGTISESYCPNPGPNPPVNPNTHECEEVEENGKIVYYGPNGEILSGKAEFDILCGTPTNPNVCTQKTVTKMPTLCDVGTNGAYIKVTNPDNPEEPTDVKNCILNSKDDVGNSYQMLDGQVKKENPYCSVFCKEEYEMSLPGAQYTTSGRFFMLDNAKVNATRTCYATGGKNGTEYIDIDSFKKDVDSAQREVIEKYNIYAEAKAKYDSANDPDETASNSQPITSSQNAASAQCSNPFFKTEAACKQNSFVWSGAQSACSDSKTPNEVVGKEKTYVTYDIKGTNSNGQLSLTAVPNKVIAKYGYTYVEESVCKLKKKKFGDYEELTGFEEDMNKKKAEFTAALQSLNTILDHMEDCYDWKNNLCLDPVLEFDYNESYNTKVNYKRVDGGSETVVGEKATYSNQKTIDNEYTTTITNQVGKIGYLKCDDSGCSNTNQKTISLEYYFRKIETKGNAEYANAQQFQTNYPHGTIDTVEDKSQLKYNYSYLGAVFPIALTTDRGAYQWTLNFSKLGMYNDEASCRLGRFDEIIKDAGGNTNADLEYVCVYVVDCDDCEFDCVGPGCLIEDEPSCPECDIFCDNCIFDGKNAFFFREITVNDTNPANRVLGGNLTTEKGKESLTEIETIGENVYAKADYVFEMTPQNMKAIRDYNEKTDTYVEEVLKYKVQNNITNAFGESLFLTNGLKNGFFKMATMNRNFTLWPGAITNNTGPAWKVGS